MFMISGEFAGVSIGVCEVSNSWFSCVCIHVYVLVLLCGCGCFCRCEKPVRPAGIRLSGFLRAAVVGALCVVCANHTEQTCILALCCCHQCNISSSSNNTQHIEHSSCSAVASTDRQTRTKLFIRNVSIRAGTGSAGEPSSSLDRH